MFEFSRPPATLEQAVQEAGGAFSVCWSNMAGAGVFESDKALEVSEGLCAWIRENYVSKVDAEEQAQQRVGDYQRKMFEIKPQFGGEQAQGQATFGGGDDD